MIYTTMLLLQILSFTLGMGAAMVCIGFIENDRFIGIIGLFISINMIIALSIILTQGK